MSTFKYKDYTESAKVKQYEQQLKQLNSTKPAEYQSQYQGQMDKLLNDYNNRKNFSYDANLDPLYRQYKDIYVNQGKLAMQNTVAQAAAMTGGFGNSYGVTAGNQAFQGYLQNLNSIIPELQSMAYDKYKQEGQDMLNKYSLMSNADDTAYSRYQDTVSRWNNERDYLSNLYNNERTYDRSVYEGDRSFNYGTWSDDRNYNYQVQRDKVTDEQWAKEFAENQRQYNANLSLQKAQLAASKASYSSTSKPNRLTNAEFSSLQAELMSYKENNDNKSIANRLDYLENSGQLTSDEADALYEQYVTNTVSKGTTNFSKFSSKPVSQ